MVAVCIYGQLYLHYIVNFLSVCVCDASKDTRDHLLFLSLLIDDVTPFFPTSCLSSSPGVQAQPGSSNYFNASSRVVVLVTTATMEHTPYT